jgi:hypothetical protein
MSGLKLLVLTILGGSAMVLLSFLLVKETGSVAAWCSGIYAVLVTLFLIAQIYAFVISQVNYSENVEEAKFKMLDTELEGFSGSVHKTANALQKKVPQAPAALSCLVCGVDSKPVLGFFIWLVGLGLLASICVLIWGYFTGKFKQEETASRIPLDAESDS